MPHSLMGSGESIVIFILNLAPTVLFHPEFTEAFSSQNGSYFRGLGPRVGFSFEKTYKHGFGIDGEISGAFLKGVSEVVANMRAGALRDPRAY